jgi:hypothetical protein
MSAPTLVKFRGGPLAGQAEVSDGKDYDPVRGSGAIMAEMAYRDYTAHPPAPGTTWWVLCRIYEGRMAGPHFYKIVAGERKADKLELTCEYGGREYPADQK